MNVSFRDFFHGVWGYEPFPWQTRLADRVAESGWPKILDLPTGSGKTATMDVALYDFVCRPTEAPRRIVLVVDRRVIVDQVADRAEKIRIALTNPRTEATKVIAERLRKIVDAAPDEGGPLPLLSTAVLRGATLRDESWARHPHVPVLAASTVDQVGSRFFFRGYGLTDGSQPIHAGLLGCDTLLLLDEVHLARPFADVLRQTQALRARSESPVPRRFQVVELSATPDATDETPFRLEEEDREDEVLAFRLAASKPATLGKPVKVAGDESTRRRRLAERAAKEASKLVRAGKRSVAVVVNRVETARRVAELMADEDVPSALLTGRMRPLDQQTLLEDIRGRVLAGREDDKESGPFVLVATQCIEAGADFDFDGLVTECASLDALRQRFGRLDRRGGRPSAATILIRSDNLRGDDAVYGTALAETWAWLTARATDGTIDFGIDALQPHLEESEELARLRPTSRAPAVVMPAYLDLWSQTRPRPHVDPDVSVFLHGVPEDGRETAPDIQVVWRADLEDRGGDADADDDASARLAEVAPGSLEALSLPAWTVRSWLGERVDDDLADVEGQRRPEAPRKRPLRPFIVRSEGSGNRRRKGWKWTDDPEALRPGSTIVVPSSYGGVGRGGTFEPMDTTPVTDLGDAVQLLQRGRLALRASRVLELPTPEAPSDEDDPRQLVAEAFDRYLADRNRAQPWWLEVVVDGIAGSARRKVVPVVVRGDKAVDWLVTAPALGPTELRALVAGALRAPEVDPASPTTTDDTEERASHTGACTELPAHLAGVAAWSAAYASACGLAEGLVASLQWAGRLHDLGKADPRFQLMMHSGDEVAAMRAAQSQTLLAKSGIHWLDRAAIRRARTLARYPRGQRHELVSVAMVDTSAQLRAHVEAAGADWTLVLHLVASHHGWCRPLAPVATFGDDLDDTARYTVDDIELSADTKHGMASIDSGVTERFWSLTRRYGWHELAYLEALLRLGDMRRSEAEQRSVG